MISRKIIIAAAVLLAGCTDRQARRADLISVSIDPQRYFIEQIAGGDFEVNVVVPAGTNPEIYEPTPDGLKRVASSTAYLAMGNIDFEPALIEKIRQNNPGLIFMNLSDGVLPVYGSHHHAEGDGHDHRAGIDPHVWMAPREVKIIATNILVVLKEMMPDSSAKYDAGYREFVARLDSMDSVAARVLGEMPVKTVLVQHPALTYLARDYGFTQMSIEDEGKEPSVRHMKELVDKATAASVKRIFCQREFSPAPSEAIAKEIGAEVVMIDLLTGDWENNMYRIIHALNYR